MSEQKSKNEKAWAVLFSERSIVKDVDANGVHHITAADINKKREARLMTKFDHKINLPDIFAENDLAILPNSRSSYVIGRFDCYEALTTAADDTIEAQFPPIIQSLSPDNLYSEASALLCAQHAGLMEDLLDEPVALTVFGRMSTGEFDFRINSSTGDKSGKHSLSVDRAQCEIDGGFESASRFAIVEVKNQEVDDFNVRQLYYPYRLWQDKLKKPVVPIFLTYSNEVFTFSVYEFHDTNEYNSLELVKRKRYQIVATDLDVNEVRSIITQTKIKPEPSDVPFPQANSFKRVIDLLAALRSAGGTLTQDDITVQNAFDIRQTGYYTSAGRYLGLVERHRDAERGVYYALTSVGQQVMSKAPRARNRLLIEQLMSRRVIRAATEQYLKDGQEPSKAAVVGFMKKAGLSITGSTLPRRAESVQAWARWIVDQTRPH